MVYFMQLQCPEEDSNLQAIQHEILNLACLPFHHQGFYLINTTTALQDILYSYFFIMIITLFLSEINLLILTTLIKSTLDFTCCILISFTFMQINAFIFFCFVCLSCSNLMISYNLITYVSELESFLFYQSEVHLQSHSKIYKLLFYYYYYLMDIIQNSFAIGESGDTSRSHHNSSNEFNYTITCISANIFVVFFAYS